MLDQNSQQPNGSPNAAGSGAASQPSTAAFDPSHPLEGAPKFIPVRASQLNSPAAPISVPAPRSVTAAPRSATAVPLPASPSQVVAGKLSDLVNRADRALPRLEARLAEEQAATDRAARLTADIEERLKLGVRMLQAFDVQSARGDSIASRAVQAIDEVERVLEAAVRDSHVALQSETERLTREKLDEIARELDSQRERFRQFEESAGQLAQEKLDRIQTELDAQLGRLKRADLDATSLADERLASIRSLCDAQVDRLSRAAADSAATAEQSAHRVLAETESHINRLAEAQQRVDLREAERIEKFNAEVTARAAAVATLAERRAAEAEARIGQAAADAEARTARLAEQSIASLEAELNERALRAREAEARILQAAADAEARTERLAEQSIARLESELNWRIERVKEVEARIEHAANLALAAVDAELGGRLAHIDSVVRRADEVAARADDALARMAEAGETIERSERATAALAGLSGESVRLIEMLATRVSDGTALREVLGKLIHELAAAREVVQGDMRRMRDELGWLVEKSERLTGELIDRADRAAATSESIRAVTDAAQPVLADLRVWGPILQDPTHDGVRPITTAIAGGVREELASDMQDFASALRQLATRADGAFKTIFIETEMLRDGRASESAMQHHPAPRDLARAFERELAQLGPVSTFSSDASGILPISTPAGGVAAHPPTLMANRPLDLEA